MSHFCASGLFLSAWTWQIYLCAPCFLSLHSHSMTNVKRISSLRESSRSTRTKRVSRMAVIQTVSKLADTHVLPCRVSVGPCRAVRGSQVCFLSWSHHVVFVFCLFLLEHSRTPPGSEEKSTLFFFCVILCDPVSLQRSFRLRLSRVVFWPPPPLLAAHGLDRDRSMSPQLRPLTSLPETFCLCCGCPPSSLSSALARSGRPIGHPGDRWWWVWDKDVQ